MLNSGRKDHRIVPVCVEVLEAIQPHRLRSAFATRALFNFT